MPLVGLNQFHETETRREQSFVSSNDRSCFDQVMKKQVTSLALVLAVGASVANAKNTNEDWKWKNLYYKSYGEWTTACEERSDDPAIKRCYLRYVDAYAQDPFGAFFLFVSIEKSGPQFSFEFERGTDFADDWKIHAGDQEVWAFDPDKCPIFGECILGTEDGIKFAKSLGSPEAELSISFTDREGRVLDRVWPGDNQFADSFKDLQTQTAQRGLLAD